MREQTRHRLVVAAALSVALGIRIAYAWYGNLAYDEYQHMHAAYLVAHGQTPFVDFFEHHTPLFYYFAAALIPLNDPTFNTLLLARGLTLVFHIATIVLATLWVLDLHGRRAATTVAALMTANVCLFVWGTRTYLDPYAAPFVVLAAWLSSQRPTAWRAAAAGAALTVAGLVTQKAIFAGLGFAALLALQLRQALSKPDSARAWLIRVAAIGAGATLPLLFLFALMGRSGVAALVNDAVLLNLHWKARHFPRRELTILFATDAFVYVAASCGLVHDLQQWVRNGWKFEPRFTASIFLLALTAGIFLQPVVWEEYFILVIPFATVVAGVTLARWWEGLSAASPVPSSSTAIVVLFVVLGVLDLIALRLASDNPISNVAIASILLLWMILGLSLRFVGLQQGTTSATLGLALLLVFPVVQQIDWIPRHRNDDNRARVDYVMAHTRPDQAVFDGCSGFGVFRPHAYRYWFLHDEMQLMLTEEEKTTDILAALESPKTRIVIVDNFTRMLPAAVTEYITAHFGPTPFNDLRQRRD